MHVLITGGAGFIGCNVAKHHLDRGDHVVIYDNMSRKGAKRNVEWLTGMNTGRLDIITGDIRHAGPTAAAFSAKIERIYHLAGQVAVTTSVVDPRDDFESNALGTFNVLEAARANCPEAFILYASTNKVYGEMSESQVKEEATRYTYRDLPHGIAETQPLDFHSPYGCSKGCGDQYVRDYARIYGLATVVMRQSCIYGVRQFGVEDQGWIAHFCLAAYFRRAMSIYGDGKQVRDVLWVDDLIAAYDCAANRRDQSAGEVFNIGGGPANTISVWHEFGPLLEARAGYSMDVKPGPWRPGDQRVYFSDIRKAEEKLGWKPQVSFEQGLDKLWAWINDQPHLFQEDAPA